MSVHQTNKARRDSASSSPHAVAASHTPRSSVTETKTAFQRLSTSAPPGSLNADISTPATNEPVFSDRHVAMHELSPSGPRGDARPKPLFNRGGGASALHSDIEFQSVVMIQRAFRRYKAHKQLQFMSLINTNKLERLKQIADIRSRLREICIFLVFLVVLTIASVGIFQDQDIFNTTRNVEEVVFREEFLEEHSHIFKNFEDIVTIQELQQWLEGPLFGAVYTTDTWDGAEVNPYPGRMFGIYYVVGSIRLSQLRVIERSCNSGPAIEMNFGSKRPRCYGDDEGAFTTSVESTQSFGADPKFEFGGGDWLLNVSHPTSMAPGRGFPKQWTESVRTGSNRWYPMAGFPVLLPNSNATQASIVVQRMISNGYIDLQTRVIFVDFTLYSPLMNYWVGVHADLEFPKAGGVLVSYQITPVRLYAWAESDKPSMMVAEVALGMFYLYFLAAEVLAIRRGGTKYLFKFHTLLHNSNVVIYLLMWLARMMSLFSLPNLRDIEVESDKFYDFTTGVALKATSVHLAALNVFLCWFKLVSYLSYVPKFALVTGTLSRAASTVSGFAVIFLVVLYGFSSCYMVMFGNRLADFRNLTNSGLSLLRSLLGDFDLAELTRGQYIMGPILFAMFTGLAVFVVLNILIAIISDAYNDEIEELAQSEDVRLYHEMVAYIVHLGREYKCIAVLLRVFGMRKLRHLRSMVIKPRGGFTNMFNRSKEGRRDSSVTERTYATAASATRRRRRRSEARKRQRASDAVTDVQGVGSRYALDSDHDDDGSGNGHGVVFELNSRNLDSQIHPELKGSGMLHQ